MTLDTTKPMAERELVAKWRSENGDYPESKQDCADELEALLNSRVGGEAVAWRVKDFADGWILCHDEATARREAESAGNLVQPLYTALALRGGEQTKDEDMGGVTPLMRGAAPSPGGVDERIGLPQHECCTCHGLDKPTRPICDDCYRGLCRPTPPEVTEEMVVVKRADLQRTLLEAEPKCPVECGCGGRAAWTALTAALAGGK